MKTASLQVVYFFNTFLSQPFLHMCFRLFKKSSLSVIRVTYTYYLS